MPTRSVTGGPTRLLTSPPQFTVSTCPTSRQWGWDGLSLSREFLRCLPAHDQSTRFCAGSTASNNVGSRAETGDRSGLRRQSGRPVRGHGSDDGVAHGVERGRRGYRRRSQETVSTHGSSSRLLKNEKIVHELHEDARMCVQFESKSALREYSCPSWIMK